jgi:Mycothiol maleylpyruvate isomerase N-terminal domain
MPRIDGSPDRAAVTPADVILATRLAGAALGRAPEDAWGNPAGLLEWDCWETVEHMADDLFAYATQLTPATPEGAYVPIATTATRPGGPESAIHVDRESGATSLLHALEACGALLAAMVAITAPNTRGWHPYGSSDPEGFAAMGVVETLVHAHDAAQGLRVPWEPPADLCARVLSRLFPDVPAVAPPWATLLWATGRADLPERARRDEWRWYGEPRA